MVLSSWQSHCESSPGSFDECRMVPSGRRPKTKPDDLGCKSVCTGCQNLHPPLPFIITQPESWYSFYRPTEGRRLSRPSWLVTYRDGLPVHRRSPLLVLTGSNIGQLRWSRPMHYHLAKPPTKTLSGYRKHNQKLETLCKTVLPFLCSVSWCVILHLCRKFGNTVFFFHQHGTPSHTNSALYNLSLVLRNNSKLKILI